MKINDRRTAIHRQEATHRSRRVQRKNYLIVRRDLHKEKQVRIFRAAAILLCSILLLVTMVCASTSDAQDGLTTPRIKYYTSVEIQSGDSLWSLCQDYMSEEYANPNDYIREVRQLNHLDGDSITAGSFLVLPYFSAEIKDD